MNTYGVCLAAGEGTRMKSPLPKVLHPILAKPLILWAIDALEGARCERIWCVVGVGAEQVEAALEETHAQPVLQKERKGTGHALQVALEQMPKDDSCVLVTYGDCPLISAETLDALAHCVTSGTSAGAVLTFNPSDPYGYGRCVRDEHGAICAIIEQEDLSEAENSALTECNSGIYAFNMRVLREHISKLSNNNASSEYYLTDLIALFKEAGETFSSVHVDDEYEVLGVNSQAQLAEVAKVAQMRINSLHMAAGVSMLDPSLVWIGPDATLAPGSFIQPMTFIYGESHVSSASTVGPLTTLVDTTLGANSFAGNNTRLTRVIAQDNCHIDETVAINAALETGAECGPRAYLRPGTHLLAHAKAGTHVEIKNSTIGEHSAVPHLSYIGDTTMGVYTNVGAGSITCNYNGKEKNPTRIGSDCFIGSNTMMVAPVSIGDGVVTGAGSVITQDVEDGALGLGRARQTNKAGYREKSGLAYKSKQNKEQ